MSIRTEAGTTSEVTYGAAQDVDSGLLVGRTANRVSLVSGGTEKIIADASSPIRYMQSIPISGYSASTGVKQSIPNPLGVSAYVYRAIFRTDTAQGGTSTLDIGVAADQATNGDNIFDGVNGNASPGTLVCSVLDATGNAANSVVVCGPTQFVNIGVATGNANTFVGSLLIEWVSVM